MICTLPEGATTTSATVLPMTSSSDQVARFISEHGTGMYAVNVPMSAVRVEHADDTDAVYGTNTTPSEASSTTWPRTAVVMTVTRM